MVTTKLPKFGMVSAREITDALGDSSEIRSRMRFLVEQEVVQKGKGGRGGAGAASLSVRDAAVCVLAMAAPEAQRVSEYVADIVGLANLSLDTRLLDTVERGLGNMIEELERHLRTRAEVVATGEGTVLFGHPWLSGLELPCYFGDPKRAVVLYQHPLGRRSGEIERIEFDLMPHEFFDDEKTRIVGEGTEREHRVMQNPAPEMARWLSITRPVLVRVASLFVQGGAGLAAVEDNAA